MIAVGTVGNVDVLLTLVLLATIFLPLDIFDFFAAVRSFPVVSTSDSFELDEHSPSLEELEDELDESSSSESDELDEPLDELDDEEEPESSSSEDEDEDESSSDSLLVVVCALDKVWSVTKGLTC